jgi:hypothetical protein
MTEEFVSCTDSARGPIGVPAPDQPDSTVVPEEEQIMTARVGKPAPDFEAMAYHEDGFKRIKLSDHQGHWVLLCFYPGDFTFV